MAVNVEWKARSRDPDRQRMLAAALADGPAELLEHLDTFFDVMHGRLKLRQLAADHAELIHYQRADEAGPKLSTYSRVPTDQPKRLRDVLTAALGVRGVVRKRRWLYRVGQTRIHVDEVEGLGAFLEVEVVLRPGQSPTEGERIAGELRQALQVRDEDLIACAYLDLLRGQC
jgi:predicted adenylyl cyclase CyaB